MKIAQLFTLVLVFISSLVSAQKQQKIGDNTSSITSSAVLELESTTRGFLPPRMTMAKRDLINVPATGLMIWCTDCSSNGILQFYSGSSWLSAQTSNPVAVSTDNANNRSNTSAIVGGTISSDSGFTMTARGICFSTIANPTVANSKTSETVTTGNISSNLTGLTASTLYYARTYVIGDGGTYYGNQINFTTTAIAVVQLGGNAVCDGSTPTTVVELASITGKTWMDRNMGASRAGTSNSDFNAYGCIYQWGRGNDGHASMNWTSSTAGTPANGNTTTLSTTDSPGNALFITTTGGDWRNPGKDGLWQAGSQINNPCVSGWHVPTETELKAEFTAYSITTIATAYSNGPNGGFKLVTPGFRTGGNGASTGPGNALYWSSTTGTATAAARVYYDNTGVFFGTNPRSNGESVRCVKD